MNSSWLGILLVVLGSFAVGSALQYYFSDAASQNTGTTNWLIAAEAAVGLLLIAFGLYKQFTSSRHTMADDHEVAIDLRDD